mmetsp:Transcript_145206/g.253338  ORF Transcript_145206/g.253338 Transcript_145206/m.253338 type:complete len:207 (-) Transcript_145206:1013-1633(-)
MPLGPLRDAERHAEDDLVRDLAALLLGQHRILLVQHTLLLHEDALPLGVLLQLQLVPDLCLGAHQLPLGVLARRLIPLRLLLRLQDGDHPLPVLDLLPELVRPDTQGRHAPFLLAALQVHQLVLQLADQGSARVFVHSDNIDNAPRAGSVPQRGQRLLVVRGGRRDVGQHGGAGVAPQGVRQQQRQHGVPVGDVGASRHQRVDDPA